MQRAKNVDEYIATAPKEVQRKLIELRSAIKATAPEAVESISYGMPYYGYNGRLVYFAFYKKHIGIYLPGSTIKDHQKELKDYVTARATIRFPLDEKLPLALIKKLVKARIKINDREEKKRSLR